MSGNYTFPYDSNGLPITHEAVVRGVASAIADVPVLRVSAVNSLTVATSPLSADSSSISAVQGDAGKLLVSAKQGDAGLLLVSAKQGDAANLRVSAIQSDAANLMVSAKSNDAALFRVSALGVTATTSPLSADSSSISAKQGDAANLMMSAKSNDAGLLLVSAKQGDAALQRTSALMFDGEYSAGPNVVISARGTTVASAMKGLVVAAVMADAAFARTSAFQGDAANQMVSAKSNDGGLLRVSVLPATLTVSAHEVKQSDAASLLVSAKQGDAGLLRVSVLPATLTVSAHEVKQSDAASLLVSAKQGDAALFRTSAIQGDAGVQRVSASHYPDTTGGLTMFSNFNVSTSQTVKSTAGAVYGWYAWNMDTKPVYINLYNTSGAINVGTDAIKVQIALPASAAANVTFPIGLAGFTAGIGVAAVSAAVSTATSPPAASAVGINVWYK